MKLENSCVIRAPSQKLWDYMIVIPKVATCLPWVEDVHALEDGRFAGTITLKIGIVKLRLAGNITIERIDPEQQVATMSAQAADQRISGLIQARLTMNLQELSSEETRLTVETDVNLFGKIGEFGHAMIKKKADQMMAEFAGQVAARVAGVPESPGTN